jgi:hypothetical protein
VGAKIGERFRGFGVSGLLVSGLNRSNSLVVSRRGTIHFQISNASINYAFADDVNIAFYVNICIGRYVFFEVDTLLFKIFQLFHQILYKLWIFDQIRQFYFDNSLFQSRLRLGSVSFASVWGSSIKNHEQYGKDTHFDKIECGVHGRDPDFSDRDVDITYLRHHDRKNPGLIRERRVQIPHRGTPVPLLPIKSNPTRKPATYFVPLPLQ